ncbi:CPBP family intramembrane metalloprotease [bacterium]|nr:CPBP family intramembrane metalloprotease [bacterium]
MGEAGLIIFGPSIAGIIVIALTQGKDGLRKVTQQALRWKVGWRWWLVALFVSALISLTAIGIFAILDGGTISFTFLHEKWYWLPLYFVMTILGGPLAEELGWRGFAQPYLQKRINPFIVSIIIGTVWGLWHLPIFFQAESLHNQIGLEWLPIFLIGEISLSILITWVYNKTKGSLLVGGIILHAADNFWYSILLTNETMDSVLSGNVHNVLNRPLYLIVTVVGGCVALAIGFITKWQLGKKKE